MIMELSGVLFCARGLYCMGEQWQKASFKICHVCLGVSIHNFVCLCFCWLKTFLVGCAMLQAPFLKTPYFWPKRCRGWVHLEQYDGPWNFVVPKGRVGRGLLLASPCQLFVCPFPFITPVVSINYLPGCVAAVRRAGWYQQELGAPLKGLRCSWQLSTTPQPWSTHWIGTCFAAHIITMRSFTYLHPSRTHYIASCSAARVVTFSADWTTCSPVQMGSRELPQ